MSAQQASQAYRPAPGSVTARIVEHFLAAPDLNEMSSAQIAERFAIPTSNISGLLEKSVEAGLLVKRVEGRVCYYRARRDGEAATPASVRTVQRRTGEELAAARAAAAGQGPVGSAAAARTGGSGLTAALYSDGELYLHGVQHLDDGGVLLSVGQAAELVAYLRHAGAVALHLRDCGEIQP